MENEKNKKYGCRIFCIYFNNGSEEEARNNLINIANLGKTNKLYDSNSLDSLNNIFVDISNIIQKNYKLGLTTNS